MGESLNLVIFLDYPSCTLTAPSNLGKLLHNGLISKGACSSGNPHVFYSRAACKERQRLWPALVSCFCFARCHLRLIFDPRLAATLGSKSAFRKLPKRSVLTADISQLCDLISQPAEPLALRLSSNLMFGVVR